MVDWFAYDHRIGADFEGATFGYTIDNVEDNQLEMLWDKVEEHYSRPLDFEWSMFSIPISFLVLTPTTQYHRGLMWSRR